MINSRVLIYQKFSGPNEPLPPFEGKILKDNESRWIIEYDLLDGTPITKRILKACCSTKPIDSFVEDIKEKNKKKRAKKKAIKPITRAKLDL